MAPFLLTPLAFATFTSFALRVLPPAPLVLAFPSLSFRVLTPPQLLEGIGLLLRPEARTRRTVVTGFAGRRAVGIRAVGIRGAGLVGSGRLIGAVRHEDFFPPRPFERLAEDFFPVDAFPDFDFLAEGFLAVDACEVPPESEPLPSSRSRSGATATTR